MQLPLQQQVLQLADHNFLVKEKLQAGRDLVSSSHRSTKQVEDEDSKAKGSSARSELRRWLKKLSGDPFRKWPKTEHGTQDVTLSATP